VRVSSAGKKIAKKKIAKNERVAKKIDGKVE
jgi:hypothetical protein